MKPFSTPTHLKDGTFLDALLSMERITTSAIELPPNVLNREKHLKVKFKTNRSKKNLNVLLAKWTMHRGYTSRDLLTRKPKDCRMKTQL